MNNGAQARRIWIDHLIKVAMPVLEAAAVGKLRQKMQIQEHEGTNRRDFSYFECAGRLLCGISAWLDCPLPEGEEKELQKKVAFLCRKLIEGQVNPSSPDYADFPELCRTRSQILVDAAFMAQAMLRAPKALVEMLDPTVKRQVIDAFLLTRRVCPYQNNWILFSAEVEAGIKLLTGEGDLVRVDYGIRQLEQWYVGDGMYADGPHFAMDYYNSFVIHPMLLDCARAFPELYDAAAWQKLVIRAQRYAELQERMIAPDGSFAPVGRSLAYRCGAFQLLAELARIELLPLSLPNGSVRQALTAVIERTLGASSFRKDGFLTMGLCGDQPSIGESYISTGSLYLCSAAFLPLGLAPDAEFWTAEPKLYSQQLIWGGADFSADHKID